MVEDSRRFPGPAVDSLSPRLPSRVSVVIDAVVRLPSLTLSSVTEKSTFTRPWSSLTEDTAPTFMPATRTSSPDSSPPDSANIAL